MEWWILAVAWVAMVGLGGWVAGQKRRCPREGLALGLLFGPLGVIVEGLLPVGDRESSRGARRPETTLRREIRERDARAGRPPR